MIKAMPNDNGLRVSNGSLRFKICTKTQFFLLVWLSMKFDFDCKMYVYIETLTLHPYQLVLSNSLALGRRT